MASVVFGLLQAGINGRPWSVIHIYRKLQTLRYMKCQQLKVYRYIMPSSFPKLKIGSFIPIPKEQVSTNNEKGNTEDLFEAIRGQYSPWAISRKSALFVLPYCRKFVDNWIRIIFRNNLVKYSIVTSDIFVFQSMFHILDMSPLNASLSPSSII